MLQISVVYTTITLLRIVCECESEKEFGQLVRRQLKRRKKSRKDIGRQWSNLTVGIIAYLCKINRFFLVIRIVLFR